MPDTEGDIQRFKGDIPALAKLLNMRVGDVIRHTALAVVAKIIPAHPVDTGYSRANWRVSADAPDPTVSVPPSYLAKRGGGLPGTAAKGWYPQRLPSGADINGENVTSAFVTNSVHYVRWLENGTTRTAPLNFIRNAAMEVAASMNEFVRKAKENNPPPHT
jgi:hypothetical protein